MNFFILKITFNSNVGYFAKNLASYKYSSEDFILKRKYILSNECFELKKLKSEKTNLIFINTDLPSLIYINKETPVVSNFNIKECHIIKNIQSLDNVYAFIFREKVILGSLNNSQSQNIVTKQVNKQVYNLTNVEKINAIAYIEEEQKDELSANLGCSNVLNTFSASSLVIIDHNLNEISKFSFERRNENCVSFSVVDLPEDFLYINKGSIFFAVGTAILDDNFKEPENGFIIILELTDKFKFNKIFEIETRGAVYKIASVKNVIYVSIASCFYIYKLSFSNERYCALNFRDSEISQTQRNNTSVLRSYSDAWDLKLLKKINEFNFIYDFICHDEYVLISDIYRSVTLFRYDVQKEKFQELTRDFNTLWCNSLVNVDAGVYTVSDIHNNIYNLKCELQPKSDEEKYKYVIKNKTRKFLQFYIIIFTNLLFSIFFPTKKILNIPVKCY